MSYERLRGDGFQDVERLGKRLAIKDAGFVLIAGLRPHSLGPIPRGRTKMVWRSFGVLMIANLFLSGSAAQQRFQQLETFQQLEGASEFERALAAVDAIKQRKKLQCVMAISNGRLCGCLARMLPVDAFIRNYGSLVVPGGSPEFEQLSAVDQKNVVQCLNENR
jgi:hypothetical protein